MNGAEAFIEELKAFGVKEVFGAGGSAYGPIQDALIDHAEIRYYLALHEMCNTAMADGFARATGRPSVAMVHVTVGAVNALGSIFCAYRDHTPLIILAGDQHTTHLGRKSYNESPGPLVNVARPFVKWSWQVLRSDRIPEDVAKAFKIALSPPRGPVFLSMPRDLMLEEFGGTVPEAPRVRVFDGTRPSGDATRAAAELIQSSEQPAIVIGSGVAISRCSAQVAQLAERIGAPIFIERNSYFIDLPTDHPLYVGDFLPEHPLVKSADLILSIGGRTDIEQHSATPNSTLPPSSKVIQINLEPEDLGLVHQVDVGIAADPRAAVEDLLRELSSSPTPKAETRRARVTAYRKTFGEAIDRRIQAHWNTSPVKLGRFVKEMAAMTNPKETVLIGHGSGIQLVRHLLRPWTIFEQNGPGYLGWILSASLGVKLGLPDRRVICFLGDGNMMFGPQALWTAAKYGIGVTVVVMDNRFYLSELTDKNRQMKNPLGADIGDPHIDFVKMAESMHVPAARVERPAHIQPALKKAFATEGPFVIDLLLDLENPGSIVRDSLKGSG